MTGAVGRTMLRCLEEIDFPAESIHGFATARSAGERLQTSGRWGEVVTVEELSIDRLEGLDLILLSAGSDVSREIIPALKDHDTWVVDNSSAFRMDPAVPLIVPEINSLTLPSKRGAIANPNCSTIQMVLVLAPLAERFGLQRVHVATYQSVSGIGQRGVVALEAEREGKIPEQVFPKRIDRNVIAQCDSFLPSLFTREEEKLVHESRRILNDPELLIHPTCARVPVETSHCEAIHVELLHGAGTTELKSCLAEAPGVRLLDAREREEYPTPIEATGTNDVWVGRIRQDLSDPKVAELWVVSDNLRKGAAWNAVQIAALLYESEQ